MKCAKCLEIFAETNISNKHNSLRGFGSFNSPEDHKTPDTIITSQTDMSTIKKSMIDFSNINLVPGKTQRRNKIDHNLQNEYEKFINKDDDINDLTADATSPLPNDDDQSSRASSLNNGLGSGGVSGFYRLSNFYSEQESIFRNIEQNAHSISFNSLFLERNNR